jgi:hypothetical protein
MMWPMHAVGHSAGRRDGWQWFFAWAVAGFGLAFSVIGLASVGLLTFPFAIAAVVWLLWESPPTPAAVGAVTGVGCVPLLVAFLNRDYHPCEGPLSLPPGGSSISCGGLDPQPWLVAGLVIATVPLVAFAVLQLRRSE